MCHDLRSAAASLAFVFAHSLQGSTGSWAKSNVMAELLKPMLLDFSGALA